MANDKWHSVVVRQSMTKGVAAGAGIKEKKPEGLKKKKASKKRSRSAKKTFRITSGGKDATYMKKLVVGKGEHYILRCNGGGRITIDYLGVKSGGMLTRDADDAKVVIGKLHCEPGAMIISKKF